MSMVCLFAQGALTRERRRKQTRRICPDGQTLSALFQPFQLIKKDVQALPWNILPLALIVVIGLGIVMFLYWKFNR
jgi:hypothetical protein